MGKTLVIKGADFSQNCIEEKELQLTLENKGVNSAVVGSVVTFTDNNARLATTTPVYIGTGNSWYVGLAENEYLGYVLCSDEVGHVYQKAVAWISEDMELEMPCDYCVFYFKKTVNGQDVSPLTSINSVVSVKL